MSTVYFTTKKTMVVPVTTSVVEVNKRWWQKVMAKVNKAIVYLDSSAATCSNWFCDSGVQGLSAFFSAGATNVKEFSNTAEGGGPGDKKCVFILNEALVGKTLNLIRSIVQSSNFEHCVVITSFSAAFHKFANSRDSTQPVDENESFCFLEHCIQMWLGTMSSTVEILQAPVTIVPFTSSFFITPIISNLYPKYVCGDKYQQQSAKPSENCDADFLNLKSAEKIGIKMLCEILNDILESLDIREDVYTVGKYSRLIARHLDNLNFTKSRRKSCRNRGSLLLIDRSLDIPSAVSNSMDCLMDRIMQVLPKRPAQLEYDVTVDMSCLADSKSSKPGHSFVPGTFSQLSTEPCRHVVETAIFNRPKQAMHDISRLIMEALRQENIEIPKTILRPAKDSAERLQSLIELFSGRKHSINRHLGLLQQALAITQVLKNSDNVKLDKLAGIEKLLVQSLCDSEAVVVELIHLMRTRHEKDLTVEDLLLLLMYIVPSLSIENPVEKNRLQKILLETIIEEKEFLSEFLKSKVGETDKDCFQFVEDFYFRLEALKTIYSEMKTYRSAFELSNTIEPPSHKPILKAIMRDIFNPEKPELADIEYKSSGLGTMLKSGFSLFVNVGKPRPNDNPFMLIYVIGGITADEARQMNEVVKASNSDVNVIIGSTSLIKPVDNLYRLWE